jgi:hypothetical protein
MIRAERGTAPLRAPCVVIAGEPGDDVKRASPSASANAFAPSNRSAGSFASAVITAASTCAGTVSRVVRIGVGLSVSTLATIACTVLPVNGGSPVSISYVTAPSAYTSVRASMARSPIACSGLMYCGVPSESPVCVMRAPPALCTASAMPKSATSALPSCSRIFSGLMSRWITPWRCA